MDAKEKLKKLNWLEGYGNIEFDRLELRLIDQERRVVCWLAFGLRSFNLRKNRARMMVEAYKNRAERWAATKGNTMIRYEMDDMKYLFYYRETLIMTWCPMTNELEEVPCDYDGTSGTHNQRNMIKQAVEEFNRVVFSWS